MFDYLRLAAGHICFHNSFFCRLRSNRLVNLLVVTLKDSLGSLLAVVVLAYWLHHVDTSLKVLMLFKPSGDRCISDFFLLIELWSFSFGQVLLIVGLLEVDLRCKLSLAQFVCIYFV